MEIAIAVLVGIVIFQGVISQLDKREAVRRERELLNRVMSRDYAQYAPVEALKNFDIEDEGEPEEIGVSVE